MLHFTSTTQKQDSCKKTPKQKTEAKSLYFFFRAEIMLAQATTVMKVFNVYLYIYHKFKRKDIMQTEFFDDDAILPAKLQS